MQYHIQTLVKHLFDKDSFEQVTVQELKQFTEAYPYAAVGQYLYAKKLYDARSWNYYEQTEQASLYFHNPLWYRWLMDQKHETPAVLQRQEEPVQQNAYRVVVQMPKGVSPTIAQPKEEEQAIKEPVHEAVAEENHTGSVAAIETVHLTDIIREPLPDFAEMPTETAPVQPEEASEAATHLQEYLPEINAQEPLQADTEAFGFVQADGTPPAEYTETVTDNTTEQQQPDHSALAAETPVYTEEHELKLHEFQPATDAAPIQASTEAFGDIQEKDASETYTEIVTHNTGDGYQAQAEETAPAIENIAGIPAAKEEVEATPEFFAEVAAAQSATAPEQEEATTANAVAIAESSLLADKQHTAGSGEWNETTEAPAAYEATETVEAPAAYETQETTEAPGDTESTESPVVTETAELAAAAETAEAPVTTEPEQAQEIQEVAEVPIATEPEQVQEAHHEVTEPIDPPAAPEYVTAWQPQEDEVQAGGDLPPYQLLDNTTEIPVAEAIEEKIEQEPIPNEPVHEGPVTIEFVQEEPVAAEMAVHEEPVQHEPPVVEEPAIGMTAQEENVTEPAVQEHETANIEPIHDEPVAEPITEEPIIQSPEPVQWKAEPVFTPANTEPKIAINTEEPIFESYHTIDYFASQGIKLGQEDFKDRLGKQLKSFTEWLRSMKRIVPTEASASLDDVTTRSIQRIAEHSVEEKEVITEAMAEVWAKQGHPEKAISIYEKLSLLNPAKSTYFAGRIEQLKVL